MPHKCFTTGRGVSGILLGVLYADAAHRPGATDELISMMNGRRLDTTTPRTPPAEHRDLGHSPPPAAEMAAIADISRVAGARVH